MFELNRHGESNQTLGHLRIGFFVFDTCYPTGVRIIDRSSRMRINVKTKFGIINALFVLLIGIFLSAQSYADNEISGFPFVQDDGSFRISDQQIHLYGIYIPPTGQTYYTFVRPISCGSRASSALDFKISSDFMHCMQRVLNPDGSILASCTASNEDLSEWILMHGWAVALPTNETPCSI